MAFLGTLVLFGVVAYVQSIFFTWQSRARNQNDVAFFRKANYCALIAMYVQQCLIASTVFEALKHGSFWKVIVTGTIFVICSNHSAVKTVKYLIEHGR